MNLNKLFPTSTAKKQEKKENAILYTFMVEMNQSYEDFRELPIPVISRLLTFHNERKKAEERANKKR